MRTLQARERLERSAFKRMIDTELKEQLRFARAKVPQYSSGPWSQSLAHGDPTQLSSWPILDRATVRARGSELRVRGLRPGGGGFHAALAAQLTELVRNNFGRQCEVEIERVSVVPREASGKFRYYRPPGLRQSGQSIPAITPDYGRKHEDRLKMV